MNKFVPTDQPNSTIYKYVSSDDNEDTFPGMTGTTGNNANQLQNKIIFVGIMTLVFCV